MHGVPLYIVVMYRLNSVEYNCQLFYVQAYSIAVQLSTVVTYRLTAVQYNCPLLLRTGLLHCSTTVHCCYVQAYCSAVQLSTVVT